MAFFNSPCYSASLYTIKFGEMETITPSLSFIDVFPISIYSETKTKQASLKYVRDVFTSSAANWTGSFTGSFNSTLPISGAAFYGTSSYSPTSSYALTASFTPSTASYTLTASFTPSRVSSSISSSYALSASYNTISGSYSLSSSYALTASYAQNINTIGKIITFATGALDKIPNGYLICDGSSLSQTVYSNLFNVIGTTFGSGAGSFNIPNLQGLFIRGFNDVGGTYDVGRLYATYQADAYTAHTHSVGIPYSLGTTVAAGYIQKTATYAGLYGKSLSNNTSGAAETRPKSIALTYCIRY